MYINSTYTSEYHWATVIGFDKTIRIFLNGMEVNDVTECDDEEGFIVQNLKDEDGQYVWEDEVVVQMKRVGKVEIRVE